MVPEASPDCGRLEDRRRDVTPTCVVAVVVLRDADVARDRAVPAVEGRLGLWKRSDDDGAIDSDRTVRSHGATARARRSSSARHWNFCTCMQPSVVVSHMRMCSRGLTGNAHATARQR